MTNTKKIKGDVVSGVSLRLKEIVKLLNITYKELSEGSGVPYRTLQSYITGSSSPTAGTLSKISKAFNIDLNWLVNGEGSPFLSKGGYTPTLPAEFINRLKKDLGGMSFDELIKNIPFFDKMPDVLKNTETLSRIEIIKLAKVLGQPVEDYLVLADSLPKVFDVALKDKKLVGLLRSADMFTAEEINDVIETIGVMLQGYIARKGMEKNIEKRLGK